MNLCDLREGEVKEINLVEYVDFAGNQVACDETGCRIIEHATVDDLLSEADGVDGEEFARRLVEGDIDDAEPTDAELAEVEECIAVLKAVGGRPAGLLGIPCGYDGREDNTARVLASREQTDELPADGQSLARLLTL